VSQSVLIPTRNIWTLDHDTDFVWKNRLMCLHDIHTHTHTLISLAVCSRYATYVAHTLQQSRVTDVQFRATWTVAVFKSKF